MANHAVVVLRIESLRSYLVFASTISNSTAADLGMDEESSLSAS